MSTDDIPGTVGALFVGAFISAGFSGIVTAQCCAYFKYYSADPRRIKFLVAATWILDFCHSFFIGASIWYYLIAHFGNRETIDNIPWSLAFTIALTAILTFLVHCFLVHRIHRLSQDRWTITIPLISLAIARLAAAAITTGKMIVLKDFTSFMKDSRWTFTLGLALSSALDVLITAFLFHFLLDSRRASSAMTHVIDKLMIYAFENGSLTCLATIISMICWVSMPSNLVFMALHFIIGKFYANSLLATLNTRKGLQESLSSNGPNSSAGPPLPVLFPEDFQQDSFFASRRSARRPPYETREMTPKKTSSDSSDRKLKVNVQKTVEYTVDEGSPSNYTS